MSPEQVKGRVADQRSDVWAFGCVLFEMLAGTRAFGGEDVSDTLAAVLRGEPDWTALPADVPAAVRTLIRGCLEKDRQQRIGDMSAALFVLNEPTILAPPASVSPAAAAIVPRPAALAARGDACRCGAGRRSRRGRARLARDPGHPAAAPRLAPADHPAERRGADHHGVDARAANRHVAITPDGTRVVYVGANGTTLFVRPLDQLDATPLTGLGAPTSPFVSPDGQWIGFADGDDSEEGRDHRRPGGDAGPPRRRRSAARPGAPDGTIVFATSNAATGLQRIAAGGGEPTVLTRPDRARGEADHFWPEFLPGGQAVLFTITAPTGGLDQAQIAVLDLRTGKQTTLIRGGSDAHYVPSGHLVYGAAGALRAVGFDLARLAVVGTSVPVVPQVVTTAGGAVDVAVAGDGTLVYVPGVATRNATDTGLGRPAGPGDADPRAAAHVRPAADLARRRPRGDPRDGPGGRHLAVGPGPRNAPARDVRSRQDSTRSGRGMAAARLQLDAGRRAESLHASGGRDRCRHAADRESQRAARDLPLARRHAPGVLRKQSRRRAWDVMQLRLDGTHAGHPARADAVRRAERGSLA